MTMIFIVFRHRNPFHFHHPPILRFSSSSVTPASRRHFIDFIITIILHPLPLSLRSLTLDDDYDIIIFHYCIITWMMACRQRHYYFHRHFHRRRRHFHRSRHPAALPSSIDYCRCHRQRHHRFSIPALRHYHFHFIIIEDWWIDVFMRHVSFSSLSSRLSILSIYHFIDTPDIMLPHYVELHYDYYLSLLKIKRLWLQKALYDDNVNNVRMFVIYLCIVILFSFLFYQYRRRAHACALFLHMPGMPCTRYAAHACRRNTRACICMHEVAIARVRTVVRHMLWKIYAQ